MIDSKVKDMADDLQNDIKKMYEEGLTIMDAERLAAKFLGAQMTIANEIRSIDLDSRMRKSGVKAIKAAVYLSEVQKVDKKPSDTLLEQLVNSSDLVSAQQEAFDEAEVDRDLLLNYLNIFKEAHIFTRSISKGRFDG